jgi:hypothetical protein
VRDFWAPSCFECGPVYIMTYFITHYFIFTEVSHATCSICASTEWTSVVFVMQDGEPVSLQRSHLF